MQPSSAPTSTAPGLEKRGCDFALSCEPNLVERFFNKWRCPAGAPTGDENGAGNLLGGTPAEWTEVGLVWCCEPAQQVDPGCPEAPLAVAASTQTMLCDAPAPPSAAHERRANAMDVIDERCCGLDVHKKSVVACLLISSSTGEP